MLGSLVVARNNQSVMRIRLRSTAFWPRFIIAVHVCLIPIAIVATRYAYGVENALTLRNQHTWTPIVTAQSILLAMYLAFGSGALSRRFLCLCIGSLSLTFLVAWAYSMLSTFPDPKWKTFLLQMRTNSLWILLPAWLSAFALLMLRPFIGGIEPQGDAKRSRQFSLQDAFIVTALVAVATAWFSYVARIEVDASNAKHIYDVIPIVPLASMALRNCLGILATVCLAYSRQYRWLGALALLGWLAWFIVVQLNSTTSLSLPVSAIYHAYMWGIVLATVLAYRAIGYGM